jgi:hypothetical protein
VETAEHLTFRGNMCTRNIRVTRGLPQGQKEESESLKSGGTTFTRKKDILFQSWRDTRVVNIIPTIHNSRMVDGPRRHEQVKKKPLCISQHNMFM